MLRLVLPLAVTLAGCGSGAASGATRVELGGLPELERALEERHGHPCLVNFWATWCGPCVAELPDLASVADEYAPQGLRVLAVSYDLMVPKVTRETVVPKVEHFLARKDIALDTLIFDGPDFNAIDARFDLPGAIPVTLAFDREGKLVGREEGEASRERFVELARLALGP